MNGKLHRISRTSELRLRSDCTQCLVSHVCLLSGADDVGEAFDKRPPSGISKGRILRRNDVLCHQGGKLTSVYVVRSGAFKRVMYCGNGEESVMGFYLPGDVIGLDSLASETHPASAIALQTSSVCAVPQHSIDDASRENPAFYHSLLRSVSRGIIDGYQRSRLLAHRNADERAAGFLLHLADAFAEQGLRGNEFTLPMSRQDIASYLCLAFETVSRALKSLADEGHIEVNQRQIVLLDRAKLRALAEGIDETPRRAVGF